MKKLLLLNLILIITTAGKAQITINFETPDSLLQIDTANVNNVWQIGAPTKTFFDSAYSAPNAIVTDTFNFYSDTNHSVFTLKVYDPSWGFFGPSIEVGYRHKFDTDSLQDGGYIEVSWDGGITWTNIANDPNIYSSSPWFGIFYYDIHTSSNPVLANGHPAYTGKSYDTNGNNANWQYTEFGWCQSPIQPNPYPIYLRFVFSSDSIHNNKEGWMIDDIFFDYETCEGIKEQTANGFISVFPNPATDQLLIKRKDEKTEASIQVADLLGTLIFEDKNFTAESINTKTFKPGVYLLKYSDNRNYCVKKFVVEKY